MWSRNGRELFFETSDNHIMVATYTVKGDSFVADKPRMWSEKQFVNATGGVANVDLAPGGKRIAVIMSFESVEGQKAQKYARAPYLVFEWFSKAVSTLRQPSIVVSIAEGQVKVANLTFTHPDISVRLLGPRIADIPIGAPLPDILELLVKFRPEELSDSGLSARVLAAQEEASTLIDQAMKALARLGIQREELSQFIMEQIRKRSQRG